MCRCLGHTCISGSNTTPPFAGAIGDAEVNGSHAVVSLGPFVDAGVPIPIETSSGATMHELGHNFGLVHGGITSSGADCFNEKPNYNVMNYSFATAGIPQLLPYKLVSLVYPEIIYV